MSDSTAHAIAGIEALEILDSRGRPTLAVTLALGNGTRVQASVPSGASRGSREAFEKRDGDPGRFGGLGVRDVARSIEETILPAIRGMSVEAQAAIDERLRDLDGTPNKERLGANAILAVSIATARAAARATGRPLYAALGTDESALLPLPFFNVINGGVHAPGGLDVQEFLIVPGGAPSFAEALRWGAEIYRVLGALLKKKFRLGGVGDEGGFVADMPSHEAAFEALLDAFRAAGLRPGDQVGIAIDSAASEFFENGLYEMKRVGSGPLASTQLVDIYEKWFHAYPIVSFEDGMAEADDAGWQELTARLGGGVQVLGDDNFATNPVQISRGKRMGIANAVLIKPNQIGSVTETVEAISLCRTLGYRTQVSHRSGETSDDFIADLAVGSGAGQIKSGAPCRGERLAKYNRLLWIEREIGGRAKFAGFSALAAPPA